MQTPKTAEQHTRPNHEAAKPLPAEQQQQQQGGPIFGPPTEKEHWQAIKKTTRQKADQLQAKYKADQSNLSAEPSLWPPFWEWMKEHHAKAYDDHCGIPRYSHTRQTSLDENIKPLFLHYVATDPTGAENNSQWEAWRKAKQALDESHDNAMQPLDESYSQAVERLNAIEAEDRHKKREADFERAMREQQEAKEELLMEEIGLELCRELDTSHPDLDREAFDTFYNTKSSGRINMNYVLSGPTGLCKSRAMAHAALQIAKWCCDCAWISNSSFAALVTACGPDASSAQRKEARAELKRLAEVEFLFFDDLGAVRFTEARIEHFYTLMQARYEENLTTYFTTNYDRAGIEKMLAVNNTAAEREIAGRIIRRMIGTAAEPRAHLIAFKRRKP